MLVLGGGVTGSAVSRVLESRGAHTSIFEENSNISRGSKVISIGEALSETWDLVVVSPGWKLDHPVVLEIQRRLIPVMSEVDLAWLIKEEENPRQVWLGVTGTNGKTTTVELTTALIAAAGLNVAACGNVGDTVIEAAVSGEKYEYLVLELSSFQLQWSKLPVFRATAILNIADDHLDWHGTFASYVEAKLRILDRTGLAILNADDEVVVRETDKWRGQKIFYSLGPPGPGELGVVEELLIDRAFVSDPLEAEEIAELTAIHPKAAHSVSNTLAAAGLARSIGVSTEVIRGAIRNFRPGRHRIEIVSEVDDVVWVNDSKATNPHAAAASLISFSSIIWIAGGLAKGAKMDELIQKVKGKIKIAILIGRDRELIERELSKQAPDVLILKVDDDSSSALSLMERVVLEARKHALSGDTVLLAPACASMDQFVSYADRGDQFCEAVKSLVAKR